MADPRDPLTINASPTKEFFISMLVKDIGLVRSVLDLIDNCVDGAKRLREDGDFNGLAARIELTPEAFRIWDNCGGIPVTIARDYAFRFGRAPDTPPTKHSVGQFGVGMKRAFFKIGRHFRVASTTAGERFVIEEDVETWGRQEEWQFKFLELENLQVETPLEDRGTMIEITRLHESVANDFRLENFQNELRDAISEAHQESMDKGIRITLNGMPVELRLATLLNSEELQSAYREVRIENERGPHTTVRIYVGISTSEPMEAGWYIFCNGRLVLGADQTETTGWGTGGETTIPKYHNQFARFRGYAFFDSDDAGLLPWNTTKTGVDLDSPKFRAIRLDMIRLMRPVIDFLNRLHDEKQREVGDPLPLERSLHAARPVRLSEVRWRDIFSAPRAVSEPMAATDGRIAYNKPLAQIRRAQEVLGVATYRAVGEKSFEYFYRLECEER
jgi:hypothetical protein